MRFYSGAFQGTEADDWPGYVGRRWNINRTSPGVRFTGCHFSVVQEMVVSAYGINMLLILASDALRLSCEFEA